MKTRGKAWQLIVVALLILVFSFTAFFGIHTKYGDTENVIIKGASDIRFGVDIQGGVNVTFRASDGLQATEDQLEAAQSVVENRLVALGITDYELYIDKNDSCIILEFPWKSGESDFDPESAIQEIGTTAYMTFRKGTDADGELILDGSMVESAEAQYGAVDSSGESEYFVRLTFDSDGAAAFGDATTELYADNGYISIWLDDENISTASVNAAITDGVAIITNSDFTQDEVVTLARQINSGALPFSLDVDSYETKSPTLGENSLDAMVRSGIIAFILIAILMIAMYRLPGALASIALLGQVAATLAFVSGYFPVFPSFTLTLPGIAGIILAIGIGVDANVITAERIKEELAAGKSIDGALKNGFKRGLTPIIDGNVTIVIVSVVLMGAFGPTDGIFAKLLGLIFNPFGASTAGTIYSFGYTLLVGVLLNFVFGVGATRLMLKGAAAIPALRKPRLFGAKTNEPIPVNENEPVARFDIIGKRKLFLSISAGILAVVIAASLILGVKLDTTFKGGALITLSYDGEIDASAVTDCAEEALGADNITYRTGSNMATGGQTLTLTLPGSDNVTTDEVTALQEALDAEYPDNNFEQLSISNVSPAMGSKFLRKCLVAVCFALLLILIYIAFRFPKIGGLTGGFMAIFALLNDLVVVFGTFVLLRVALNGNFIAAMLTILGYSINDTVVVYDRIRENRNIYHDKKSFEELVNLAVNQSMKRTIATTVTTVVALAVTCVISAIYSLDSVFTFVFPLTMGMISGVYTSLCISTSSWVMFRNRKKAEKK